MDVQTFQVQDLNSPSLFQGSSVKNASGNSFQQYLEEEQKRLGLLFSPFSQFNFDSWFGSADSQNQSPHDNDKSIISEGLEQAIAYQQQLNTIRQSGDGSAQNGSYLPANSANNQTQTLIQELLAKSGLLVPNLEAMPQFAAAQMSGRLLSALDLQFLVDQILSRLETVKEKGKIELILGLKPENLGEILLILTAQGGLVSIQIQAAEETKKMIQANLAELELALRKAKVNLGEIKVFAVKEGEANV